MASNTATIGTAAVAGMNPWLMAGATGLGALGDWLGGGQERKEQKWSLGQRQRLSSMFQGQMGQGGINPQLMQQLLARFRQSTQPTMDTLGAQAAQYGTGMGSGSTTRMFGNTMLPLLAGYQGQLGLQDVQMRQSHDDNLRRLLAGLA